MRIIAKGLVFKEQVMTMKHLLRQAQEVAITAATGLESIRTILSSPGVTTTDALCGGRGRIRKMHGDLTLEDGSNDPPSSSDSILSSIGSGSMIAFRSPLASSIVTTRYSLI